MESRTIHKLKKQGLLLLLAGIPFVSACIAFLPSATSKSEEERKWFLLDLVSSPDRNALISSPPTVGADGYDPALFTVDQKEDQEEIAVPIYGKHYVSVGHIFDIDVDTSKIPGAPEQYESVVMPPGQFAEITYEYDERMLRERGLIEEFQVFSYDKRSGQWIPAIDVEVDLENNRVTARTNHFTPFVLTALPAPADGGVFTPPQCIVDVLDDPAGSMTGPKWSRIDVGFKYYLDRGYTIQHNNAFYDLKLNESLGIATCNGGNHSSSSVFCGPQGQHKYNSDPDYLDFQLPFNAKVYIMYDGRGSVRANWLADMGFAQVADTFIETTDDAQYYEVYEKEYVAGSQVTLPGNHYDIDNPNQIRTNYFVAVLPQGDWAADAGIDCSGEPLRPASPEGISLIPGSDQISIVLDQTIDRDVSGLIVRRRLQEPSLSPEYGEAVGLAIEEPGYIVDTGLTEGMTYYYSFFAVTESGLYSPPLVLQIQTGPDDDGDGLANYYEINPSNTYYGGDGTKSNMADTDSDGIDDLTEILRLTDPTNGDHSDPVITLFEDDGTNSTMPVARFNIEVDDASPITGWYLSTGSEPPANDSEDWLTEEPTTWSVQQLGELTLNLWVRDEAGNVSEMASLELDFPYFEYAKSFAIFDPRDNEYQHNNVDPISGPPNQGQAGWNATTHSFGQEFVLSVSGGSGVWVQSADAIGTSVFEFSGPSPLPNGSVISAIAYDSRDDFWLVSYYIADGFSPDPMCPVVNHLQCFVTLRYDEGNKELITLDSKYTSIPENATRWNDGSPIALRLNDVGFAQIVNAQYLLEDYDTSINQYPWHEYMLIFHGQVEDGIISNLTFSHQWSYEHLPGQEVVASQNRPGWTRKAISPSGESIVVIAPPNGVRSPRGWNSNQGLDVYRVDLVAPSLAPESRTHRIGSFFGQVQYFDLAFVTETELLALSENGLELLQFDPATYQIQQRSVLMPITGGVESGRLELSRSGSLGIIKHGTAKLIFSYDPTEKDIPWSTPMDDLRPGGSTPVDRVAFQDFARGNQPPRLTVRLDKGYRIVHPGGIIYPFTGVYTAGQDCADPSFFSNGYQSSPSSKWNMAQVKYSDPDASKCGVSDSPSVLGQAGSSAPSASALQTPMDIFPNLDLRNSWLHRIFMEDLLGPVGRRICPQTLSLYGNNDAGIPITPREAGDYSLTIQATDSRGTCEGRDQTATATLHLRARERYRDSSWELIRTDSYPEPRSDLLHFTLESNISGAPKRFSRFRCQVNTVVCIRWGHLFACLPNSHLGLVNVAEESEAKCGPPIFFMKRWVSPNGNAAPLSAYKPLRKYYYKADHYWNESWDQSVYNTINFEQDIDPFDTADFRGLLFIQTETMIPIETLYNGHWFGYEDL